MKRFHRTSKFTVLQHQFKMKKLAIIITHPIQYYIPVFKLLAKKCQLKVFYTWGKKGVGKKLDPGFGKEIIWDIPMFEGYDYELLENIAKDPGSHHGKGIVNPEILDRIDYFRPHAILVYGYIYKSHLKVMRHFKGKIPIWFRGDSTLLDEKLGVKSLLKWFYLKWVYSHVDVAFHVGENNKKYFKKYGLKDKQLIFAPHAIDNERFGRNLAQEASLLRETLGIKETDILILFAGKLEAKKNPELLLKAFDEIVTLSERNTKTSNIPQKHLLFVGNGDLETSLKVKAKFTKLQNIHFLDFQNQSQMPIIYQACNIFCLPSQGPGETWGLAVNEAMAAGKAIIVSDKVGCFTDLIFENVNGNYFPNNNVNELVKSISLLTNDHIKAADFGKKSKAIIQEWSFEKQTNQIVATLNATY